MIKHREIVEVPVAPVRVRQLGLRRCIRGVGVTTLAVIALVVASWAYLFAGEDASIAELFSGGLPQALPQFLTYVLYRWEVIIRTTIIVGFVLVVGVDVVSAGLRRLAR